MDSSLSSQNSKLETVFHQDKIKQEEAVEDREILRQRFMKI